MGCDTLELPAGLIDKGESALEAAVRELREETGYVAEIAGAQVSAPVCLSPGLTNEAVQLVQLDVDADSPANRNPTQSLEETEAIQVLEVPLDRLPEELDRQASLGLVVFGALRTLRLGLEVLPGLEEIAAQVLEVPLDRLPEELDRQASLGLVVFGALQTLCLGLEVGRKLESTAAPSPSPRWRRSTLAGVALSSAALGAVLAWTRLRSRL